MNQNPKAKTILLIVFSTILVLILGYFGFTWLRNRGGLKTKETTLTVWRPKNEQGDYEALIKTYQEEHPNVKIDLKLIEGGDQEYEAKVVDAIASGEGPDIFMVRNDWIPKHYKKITPAPEKIISKKDFEDTFLESSGKDLLFEDKVYAVPYSLDNLAMIVNSDMLSESKVSDIPETWDTFVEAIKKISSVRSDNFIDRAGTALGTSNNVAHSQDILYTLMAQNHTEFLSPDKNEVYFNRYEQDQAGKIVYPGTSALDFYTSFANTGKETYTWNSSMPNSVEAFIQGKLAIAFVYPDDVFYIKSHTSTLNLETAKMPQVLGTEYTYAKYWADTVSSQSKNSDEAWNFIKYCAGKKQNKTYLEKIYKPSARKDLTEEGTSQSLREPFVEQAKYATAWYKIDPGKVDQIFRDAISAVVGGQPPQAALDAAAKEVKKLIDEAK